MRIEFGIKNSNVININLITKNKLDMSYLNELLLPFNVKIDHISLARINLDANIKTFDTVAIEYQNQYEKPEEIKKNLQKEFDYLTSELQRSKNILANASFIAKAPKEKVNLEKQKLAQYEQRYNEIKIALNKK
jgi:valyl-tRNA synthetase